MTMTWDKLRQLIEAMPPDRQNDDVLIYNEYYSIFETINSQSLLQDDNDGQYYISMD